MEPEIPAPLLSSPLSKVLSWSIAFLLLLAGTFSFPLMPSQDLDPSWRMALGYFFEHGMQFGRDVVFNYGPLGFVMGRTFSGVHFWPLIVGQLILAVVSASVIVYQASRLGGSARWIFLTFCLVFGTTYEDALHMLIIAMLGFELLRGGDEPWRHRTWVIAIILAGYAQIKFTDFLFGSFAVFLACSYSLWRGRRKEALILVAAYVFTYLGIWILLGQSLLNLPAYLAGSWQISEGWLWSMGFPAPFSPLWKGIVVLLVLVAYAGAHLWLHADKPRAWANVLMLGALVYLNWKHGFVRADGHMIGFFYCALLPLTAYPALLDDPIKFRRAHRWVFLAAIFLTLFALENALNGVMENALGRFQGKIWSNVRSTLDWKATRVRYRENLATARQGSDMYMTREIAGQSTVDVLGFETGVALLNKLNYQPRPVIQSYSTFNPPLDKLNYDLYASDRAPQFVLSKIQTIDGRLPTMDDARVLLLLAYRYEYLRTEKGFGLWKLNPGHFDPASIAPKPVRDQELPINHRLDIEELTKEPLWVKIDLHVSFLGKIRSFFYKPPQVTLEIETTKGDTRDYLMPLPQGRTGFVINPLVEDVVDYMHFANGQANKRVRSVTVKIADGQTLFFAPQAHLEFSTLKLSASGQKYFTSEIQHLLGMFQTFPVSYTAHTPVSQAVIDGRDVAILHAPSEMIFDLPPGAQAVTGKFGMMPGTYSEGGKTDGVVYVVYWSNGTDKRELFRRFMDPVNQIGDRGLQDFRASLTGLSGGRLFLEVQPGPYNNPSWDWSAWTNIKIE